MPRADLHVHTTASDGVYSPAEVVSIALEKGLAAIALTDHDTLDGIAPARAAASGTPLPILAGVELSAEDDTADRHILGYAFDPRPGTMLAQACEENKQARVQRIAGMVEKLAGLGVAVSLAEVLAVSGGGAVGRPHLARVLLRHGHVSTLQQAFEKYIGDAGPAYVPHNRLTPAHAIQMIHAAGGVAVLAHPGRYADYRAIIHELIPLGLDGIEVYYPDHTPSIVAELRQLARQHSLVMTAGSDFHRREGDGSARLGTVAYPDDLNPIEQLQARAARYT